MKLPEDRLEDVEYFLRWLYSSRSLQHPKLDELQRPANRKQKPTFSVLLRLWIFADKYSIRELQNDICDKVVSVAEQENACPNPEDTWTLYEEVNEGARIRDVVLDLFAWKRTEKLLEEHEDAWHQRFLRSLAVRAKKAMRPPDPPKGPVQPPQSMTAKSPARTLPPWKVDQCAYHDHVEGEKCFTGREHERPMSEIWV